jgi:hypothetical protein
MTNVITWFSENIGTICTVICSVILVASLIVKFTPSTKDNEILRNIINVLDKLSIAKTADDKKAIEDAKENVKE